MRQDSRGVMLLDGQGVLEVMHLDIIIDLQFLYRFR